MPTAPPAIATPPTAPARSDISTFVARADAWVAWLESDATDIGTCATTAYSNAQEAYASAVDAAAAASGVGAALWVSGTSYSIGDVRKSPANYYPYRRLTNGAGTTDPSLDPTNWTLAVAIQPVVEVVTGTSATATDFKHYILTNVAATTVTLPSAPNAGDTVWVTSANQLLTNVIARNGKNIMSTAEDLTLNDKYASVRLRYIDTTRGWVLI